MDFIPKPDWQWVFDQQKARLTLQMDDIVIDIVYKRNMLVLPNKMTIPFTVEDVARYIELFEHSAFKDYEPEFACKIILHILAIEIFHKPIMPKSWLFSHAATDDASKIDLMSDVMLTATADQESAHYLVLEDEKEFVLCMLIDKIHQISARKSLAQFQIIKVTVDKLNLVKPHTNTPWHSYQIA